MNELSIKDGVTELGVTTIDGKQAVVSSRDVADVFDKRHHHVLRDIEEVIDKASEVFGKTNFGLSSYKSGTRKYKEYLLAKDGLVMVVMGYTSEKAMQFKEAYINQFNRMEKLIRERYFTKIEYAPMMEALKESRELAGKKTNHFHYSNEADMINRIILGATAKKYCEENNIPRDSLRDNLAEWQLKAIKQLQRSNTDLIQMGLSYQKRKELLGIKYRHLFNRLELAQ